VTVNPILSGKTTKTTAASAYQLTTPMKVVATPKQPKLDVLLKLTTAFLRSTAQAALRAISLTQEKQEFAMAR